MATAIQVLRDSTQVRHAELEREALPRYIKILGIWPSAGAALDQCIPTSSLALEIPVLLPPRRAHHAQEDLLHWQQQGHAVVPGPASAEGIISALRPAQIPGLQGVCDVARGSSLGSKVIAGYLKKVLPLSAEQGMCFFLHECGQSLTWLQWSHSLGAQLTGADALSQAVVWANATFEALQHAFAAVPAHPVITA